MLSPPERLLLNLQKVRKALEKLNEARLLELLLVDEELHVPYEAMSDVVDVLCSVAEHKSLRTGNFCFRPVSRNKTKIRSLSLLLLSSLFIRAVTRGLAAGWLLKIAKEKKQQACELYDVIPRLIEINLKLLHDDLSYENLQQWTATEEDAEHDSFDPSMERFTSLSIELVRKEFFFPQSFALFVGNIRKREARIS